MYTCIRTLVALWLLLAAPIARPQSSPLRAPSPADNSTAPLPRFTRLDPERTGIHFKNTYDDPDMWGRRYREFTLGSIGAGIATGDFDQDGQPDIYAVSKTGPNKLYRQTGDLSFEDVTEMAGVAGLPDAWATGATFVDIDNDGWLDLYLCQFDAPNQLYINQRDGTFSEQAQAFGLDIVDASVMAAFSDADLDGDLDLYLVTNILDYAQNYQGRPDYFFENDNGFFRDVTERSGIEGVSQGHSATWWDYDQDGWPDIYVANDFEKPDRLYRNNGDGTYTDVLPQTFPHTPYFSMGADLGDVNNDGLMDFFVSDMAATSHQKSMRGIAELSRGTWENERLDSLFPMYMRNALYLNNGTDRFNEVAYLAGLDASDWTWAVKFADLDNDGWTDLFITNGNIRNFMDADLLEKQNVASSLAARIRVYRNAPLLNERNLAYRNNRDLRFSNVSEDWGLDYLGVSFGASYSDLDRDGDLDIVVNNLDENLLVYRNNTQNAGFLVRLQGVSSNSYGIGSSAHYESPTGTQTRQLTLARGVLSNDEPLLHFAPGTSDTTNSKLTIHWPSGQVSTLQQPQAGNIYTISEPESLDSSPRPKTSNEKAETQFTEVSSDLGWQYRHQEDRYNEFAEQLLLPRRLSKQGPALAYDSNSETLFVCGSADQALQSFAKNGVSSPQPSKLDNSSPKSDTLALLSLNGSLLTPNTLLPRVPSDSPVPSTSVITAGDFDSDGDLDIFLGGRHTPGSYPETPDSYLLENRDGTYIDVTEEVAPDLRKIGMVTSAIWSDATGDGIPDLLLALDWGPVTLFENSDGKLTDATSKSGLASYLGWWNSIAPADFNGDGLIDYVAGNTGLNTKYKASSEFPTVLYYGDFDDSGQKQIVEAQFEDENLYPIRAYSKLRFEIPSIADKFPTFADFARATLPEIIDTTKLDTATKLEANTLASGVFINNGNGTFSFSELPRLAQTAPVFGIAAQDFDGDGFTDIFLAQNSHAPEPTTGRFSGGLSLLVLGNGDGTFQPVPSAQSGLVVPGDAKSTITLDLGNDGWPDLVVAQNSDRLLAFQNFGVEGHRSFGVELEYTQSNPHGYGSKVTIIRKDGTKTTAELTSTTGYLSQSEPKLFFGYKESNKPTEIIVAWPKGNKTSHPFESTPNVTLRTSSSQN
ncbi:FG-GAP-like repeat-containing protein [Pelagicoccus sp. SDUM812002]|uniref:FG-GAP-like repeat-containing protein n=1 Tax=Pelagicoccus sp. SDUM812002 TaxID=3041266 RepID=UPI00281043BD|nr:FG-GAP-like repeat-containing protein [Pelagicoccus sp. SDUM812002]MDQ8186493.1 FG-GAP-like repeat-containing protein [Pelagicoccus sp. SDUM812002]